MRCNNAGKDFSIERPHICELVDIQVSFRIYKMLTREKHAKVNEDDSKVCPRT
jgi:hypothetical protein